LTALERFQAEMWTIKISFCERFNEKKEKLLLLWLLLAIMLLWLWLLLLLVLLSFYVVFDVVFDVVVVVVVDDDDDEDDDDDDDDDVVVVVVVVLFFVVVMAVVCTWKIEEEQLQYIIKDLCLQDLNGQFNSIRKQVSDLHRDVTTRRCLTSYKKVENIVVECTTLTDQVKNYFRFQIQRVEFQNTNLGIFWRALEWKMLVYFMAVWYILRPFGNFISNSDILCYLVYYSSFGMLSQEKIWQPRFHLLTRATFCKTLQQIRRQCVHIGSC
jgi:hypothetical protein